MSDFEGSEADDFQYLDDIDEDHGGHTFERSREIQRLYRPCRRPGPGRAGSRDARSLLSGGLMSANDVLQRAEEDIVIDPRTPHQRQSAQPAQSAGRARPG